MPSGDPLWWREVVQEAVRGERSQAALLPWRQSGLALPEPLARLCTTLEAELLSVVAARREAEQALPKSGNLGGHLSRLLDSGRFADVTLRVGGEEIRAHRAVLAARSPVFDAMLSSGMKEQRLHEVHIKESEPGTVRRMLRFMYEGAMEEAELQQDDDVVSLLELAHKYDVASLVELCVSTLQLRLADDKAADFLMIAEHLALDGFRRDCIDFIATSYERLAEVQASEGFARLAQKRPHLLIDILARAIPPAKRPRREPAADTEGAGSGLLAPPLMFGSPPAAAAGAFWNPATLRFQLPLAAGTGMRPGMPLFSRPLGLFPFGVPFPGPFAGPPPRF